VLTLDDEGRVGVKIIDSSSRVRFLPVDLISDTPDGMWLGGLPDTIELITVGHEFVSVGQQVTVSRNLQ
jgi:multidrug efflux system membrane fusion protein